MDDKAAVKRRERKARQQTEDAVFDVTNAPAEIKQNNAFLGAGRTPKALQLKNYEKVLKKLDDNIDDVMDTLLNLLHHEDPYVQIRVAELLLKKYLPDKKIKEITGAGGGPVQINQNIDIRSATLQAVAVLDSMGLEQIREQSETGRFKIIETEIIDEDECN